MNSHYDIVIVGGGMVGASLAAALIQASQTLGLKIAIIEAHALPESAVEGYQPSYDARSTALAYGSRVIYERMGLWDTLQTHLAAISDIHVSDQGRFGMTRLHAADENVPALGYVVENRWLGQVLLNRLQADDVTNIEFICPATVTDIQPAAENMQLQLEHAGESTQLTAELVVMADGGRSPLRQKMGIGYQQQDYQQHAIVTNLTPGQPHNGMAYERFTRNGPMALLPLEDQNGEPRVALVWTVPSEQLDETLALSDEDFMARLHDTFGYRLGYFQRVGERHHYPLKLTFAEEQVRSGLVLLGNAAHALHPIAGQGYNLALRGAVRLAEYIIQTKQQGQALGQLADLQAFQEQVRGDQQKTVGFSDQTMKLFSNNQPLLALGRSAGLQVMDTCPLLKTVFARSAMGLDIAAPDLQARPAAPSVADKA
ncbi:2-octaprenyl-6-methoxyphenyl hydroxylase [Aliamphritea hakodatensis]|uniref:2-octaprenyl-6-methoxyphenyl hydroxylase n=1 Tax=Aliamphritea hakodatensis TaxID=2895352 RepID=UPI0022FDA269|nr:2-octaprenyl-6-methoxyphenyl hydroxylase [Aliamphritea hakodatensis]